MDDVTVVNACIDPTDKGTFIFRAQKARGAEILILLFKKHPDDEDDVRMLIGQGDHYDPLDLNSWQARLLRDAITVALGEGRTPEQKNKLTEEMKEDEQGKTTEDHK